VDLAHEGDVGSAEERRDFRLEIGLVDLVDLGRNAQRQPGGAGDGDGMIGPFFRTDPTKERKVAATRIEPRPVQVNRNPVLDRAFGTGLRWASEIDTSGMSLKPR